MEIRQYRLGEDSKGTAKLYAEVFRFDPWNEAYKCPVTARFYGPERDLGGICPEVGCSEKLVEAYPLEETAAFIDKEASKEGAIAVVLEDRANLAGFAM